ncbi:TRAP transporter permease [Natronincola ferrireducens]|uniref:TRAP transporter, 4TM/12TM fusion protein n=1 Tax=Natronincola ferrireducens TaxID=393762 RepID=A0A1G9G3J8_9FIRM|nr:TRAP transporter permease [Natronincola ferrireducens]SDK94843.1 TRAP transporter, 4TM/12TM fusion protein [Natronincola ferrireducens]
MQTKLNKQMIINILAATFSGVYIYQAAFGFWQAHISRGLYILFALVLTFLINPKRKGETTPILQAIDLTLIAVSCVTILYYMKNFPNMAKSAGMPLGTTELIMGILAVILVLEAGRRSVGWSLSIIASVFIVYNYFGNYMPNIIYHRGYSVNRIVSVMYGSTDGIFGSVASVFSTFIFLFIIFGSFLQKSGAGQFFIELSKAAVGRFTGGAGQAAVVSSGILGSIMGSSTANTAITGAVTIPLMVSNGYKKHVAAGVEAVVSIGGQFLPPIMGAAAFLMAAFIGVPYIEIARAGLIPALLFFVSMIFMVYLEAKRSGLKGLPKEEIPKASDVLKSGWYFFIPITIIAYFLGMGYSPSMAGFWAIVSTYVVSFFNKENRMSVKDVYMALVDGAKGALAMSTTAGIVGILVAAISLPGLGMKFSSIILELAGGRLPIALLLVMIASFFLGMGMNVTSAYLLLVTLAAPALVDMGVPMIAAHFFVFWTSQLAVITPPVCLSAYVAAAIAEADVWETGWYSLRMGLAIYYLPIMFVYIPSLLWIGEPSQIFLAALTALLGVLSFSALTQGYLLLSTNLHERIMLGIASLSLMFYGVYSDIIGLGLVVAVVALQLLRKNKKTAVVTE